MGYLWIINHGSDSWDAHPSGSPISCVVLGPLRISFSAAFEASATRWDRAFWLPSWSVDVVVVCRRRRKRAIMALYDHLYTIYNCLDQQTGRKKKLFWSMTLFLANWPILGQIGQFNPNDPKWLKSGWNLIFYVFPWCPNPITSLSFTIATLVALIDPWRVWLDPWGLRFQAWAPALLFLLIFAELVHCSGIGCQLA
jgi:hypothetical protein